MLFSPVESLSLLAPSRLASRCASTGFVLSGQVFWHFSRSCRSGAKSRGSATCGGTSMTVTFELRSCDVPPPSNQIGELRCGSAVSARVPPQRAPIRMGAASGYPPELPQCAGPGRAEEQTSELQSLMRSSYAVLCLKKKQRKTNNNI